MESDAAFALALGSGFEVRGADLAGLTMVAFGVGFLVAGFGEGFFAAAGAAGFFAAFFAAGFAGFFAALEADPGGLDFALLGIAGGRWAGATRR